MKSTVVALVETMVSLLAPPSIDLPATKWPLARLIVSLPCREDEVLLLRTLRCHLHQCRRSGRSRSRRGAVTAACSKVRVRSRIPEWRVRRSPGGSWTPRFAVQHGSLLARWRSFGVAIAPAERISAIPSPALRMRPRPKLISSRLWSNSNSTTWFVPQECSPVTDVVVRHWPPGTCRALSRPGDERRRRPRLRRVATPPPHRS